MYTDIPPRRYASGNNITEGRVMHAVRVIKSLSAGGTQK